MYWRTASASFDLSQQEWVTGYTPSYASVYTQPKIVSDVYASIKLSELRWDDEAVKAILVTEEPLVVEEPAPKAVAPTADEPAATDIPAEEKKTPIGAVMGGVVSGVLGLAAIGLPMFNFVRRNKAADTTSKVEEGYSSPDLESPPNRDPYKVPQISVEGVPTTPLAEVQGSRGGDEMWTESNYHEAGGGQLHEISSVVAPGGGQVYEMAKDSAAAVAQR